MRKKFKRILIFIIFLIIVISALGIFYVAYYDEVKQGSDIKISGPLSINYENGSKLRIKKSKKTKISVINSSEEPVYFYIEFVNPKNITKEVDYKITDGKDINITDKLNNYNTIISSYIKVDGLQEKDFDVEFKCKENIRYQLEVNIEQELMGNNIFSEVIINNNEVKETPASIVGQDLATADEGLIKTTDDFGSAYYFRGNVINNNVEINGKKFKIVKINGDGSVKIVYNELTSEAHNYYESADNYMFKDSSLKTFLENWLVTELGDYKTYVSTQKYCNDNTLSGTEFLAYKRISQDKISSYLCLGDKVAAKVGLLTVDEVVYAGGLLNEENTSYYLYNPEIEESYYLMTGAKTNDNGYYPFSVNSDGSISANDLGSNSKRIRPVITINKVVSVTGDGTVDNPYILTK